MKFVAILGAFTSAVVISFGAQTAQAGDIYVGVYAHDVAIVREIMDPILQVVIGDGADEKNFESGADFELGWRSESIKSWTALKSPRIYVNTLINSDGNTNQLAAGLTWKVPLGDSGRFYYRPAIGLGVHDGRLKNPDPEEPGITPEERARRVIVAAEPRGELGSRVLINAQIGLGYNLTEKTSIEMSLVHLSHAGLGGSEENEGMDSFGIRLSHKY